MNRILDTGYCLYIPEKNDGCFVIKKILGIGASSVTYLAVYNQTEHVLKECNPLGLYMHRDDNGALIPDTVLNKVKFNQYLSRFVEGANKQLSFRLTDDLKNTTSNVQAIYQANNTVYIDMTFFNGNTFDQVVDESLYDLLRRMKALTQVVGQYHDMGYLHLDIKPQNVYVIPETPEMVMVFDFDSVVLESDIEKMVQLSYTDSWAAPEQKMAKYRLSICKATDLFAIGEIIFYHVMGRHSTSDERFDFSTYVYDREAKIFENVNPWVFRLLDDLFHKTICCAPANRIQTAKELIALFDEIIPLADSRKPFLISNISMPKEIFIGRNIEIEDIHVRLQQNSILFLHGIAGIGKSELAKQYAKKYQNEYDTIIYAPYVIDIISLIVDDSCIQINNFSRVKDEKNEEYYERKLRKFKELISDNSSRILLIVDSLDSTEDNNIKLLFELGCRVLITSRVDLGTIYNRPQMEIKALGNLALIRELFEQYYHIADNEVEYIETIINLVQGHTLSIELIAKQIDAEWFTLQEICEKLENGGLSSLGDDNIDNAKDDVHVQDSAFGHIRALFDLSNFEKGGKNDELYVLVNLSLMPFTGIERKLFADWCELDNHGGKICVNNLIKNGWIQRNRDLIMLHPLVSEVVTYVVNKEIWYNLPLLKKSIDYVSSDSLSSQKKRELASLLKNISHNLIKAKINTHLSLRFILDATYIFSKYGDIKKAINYCSKGKAFLEEIAPDEQSFIAEFNNVLGNLYSNKGECGQAELYYNEALNIRLQANDFENMAEAYNNMGTVFYEKGKLSEAIEYYQKALTILEKNHSSATDIIAVIYNNLAKVYHAQNNMEQAEILLKNAILYSVKDVDKATMYGNLGDLYYEQNKVKDAEEYYLKALKIRIELFTEFSPAVATSYNSLAKIYKNIHQISKAEYYYQKALELRLEFDKVHIDTAVSYGNLGVFYQEQKKDSLAKDNYLKAIFICEELNMNQSRDFAIYCYNLGTLYHTQNDYNMAEKYYLKALDILTTFYSEERTYIDVVSHTLEGLYW